MTKKYNKKFSVSILLWMRQDKARQEGMNYWSGPHSQIIASSPGLLEYRQQHLSETEHSFWPSVSELETNIPVDRRIDGIAEVTFENLLAPIAGRKQTALAFKDEVNVFRRTLMHMGFPFSSRWFSMAENNETQLRDVLYVRRKDGVGSSDFKKFINDSLAAEITEVAGVTEVRTQVYMPWHKATWNTPNVAHDNPKSQQLHASVIIGFANEEVRENFYQNIAPILNTKIVTYASAVHAYQIEKTLTFVENGKRISL
ncbi:MULTISPECIES: hypothetical protein [unclassified Facklamia]|uniref:hypothetical protein n=1 Tax=Aerococcaceae TaxID=186827 RepID=UPI0013B90A12|nr:MULTISPECIES: hypothetical protein [unclassified Facklamia]NEW64355.1 hypothetical protein [Facklamia sp. 252]NEW67808.1 hypothetical protein [Facklamia sp. 253]QQD64816.1 hypothetical protein JDW14_05625 [Aerococcaceae bacterium zg-252]